MHFFTFSLAVGLYFPLLSYCAPPSIIPFPALLDPQTLGSVRANAIAISTERSVCFHVAPLITDDKLTDAMYSWEIGTLAEALTELEWQQLAVFAYGSIPPPTSLAPGEAADVLQIAET
jgi:hypothetical protein